MDKIIVHISDLHIGNKFNGKSRSSEYAEIFLHFIDKCVAIAEEHELVIVITGDIFNNKSQYSGDDICLFNHLITNLSNSVKKCEIVIIPGIHDMAIESDNVTDLVLPLIKWPNVHYMRNNGHVCVGGIDFYHVSVLDQRQITNIIIETEGLCSKTNQKATNLNNPAVLLYHGILRKTKLFNGYALTSKISPEIYKHYNAIMLGELHDYQQIESNIAYAGSLIQQSPRESVEKGFVIWRLTPSQVSSHFGPSWTATHKFVRIKSGFVQTQVNLSGLTEDECLECLDKYRNPVDKTHLVVISRNSLSDKVMSAIPVDAKSVIYGQAGAEVKLTAFTEAINKIEDQTIRDNLSEMFKKDFIFTGKKSEWGLIDMRWVNMFRYGPIENRIDFTSIRGLSGIIANNNAGKTSIIDIIMLTLFNHSIRGTKSNIVRRGAKSGYSVITFYVKDSENKCTTYRVNRSENICMNMANTNVVLEMYNKDNGLWTNISGKMLLSTYVKVRELLGSNELALSTCIYYKNGLNDITAVTGQTAGKIIIECLGLSAITSIQEVTRIRICELKKRNMELENIYKPPRANLDECMATKVECEKEYKIAKKRANRRDVRKRETTLSKLSELMNDYNTRLTDCRKTLSRANASGGGAANRLELQSLQLKLHRWEATNNWDKWNIILGKHNGSEELLQKLRESSLLARNTTTEKADEIYKLLGNIDQSLCKSFRSRGVANVCDSLVERRLSFVDEMNNAPRPQPRMFGAITAIETQIRNQKEQNKYKFSDTCESCISNKNIIDGDIRALESKLYELRETDKVNVDANNKRAQMLSVATESINQIDLLMTALSDYQVKMNKYIAIENDKITEENLRNNWLIAKDMQVARNEILSEIEVMTAKAGAEICDISDYEQLEKDLINKIALLALEIDKIRQDIPTDALDVDNGPDNELEVAKCKLINADNQLAARKAYDDAAAPILREIYLYKTYVNIVTSEDIKHSLLHAAIHEIEETANNLLKLVCEFKIMLKLERNELTIHLVESTGVSPVSFGGGYQQFMISIALRFALNGSAYRCSDFIFIDEGFGCADKINAGIVNSFLQTVSKLYNNIFIITHTSGMSDIMEHKIFVNAGTAWSTLQRNESNEEAYDNININDVNNIGDQIVNQAISQQLKNGVSVQASIGSVDALPLTQMKCECGSIISRKSYPTHVKSVKHAKALGITFAKKKK